MFQKILFCLIAMVGTLHGMAQQNQLIPYRKGNVWGYSNAEGKIIIEPKFQRTYPFSADSLAKVKIKGLYGYINNKGAIDIKPTYTSASDFHLGVAKVESDKQVFCINILGAKDECNEEYIDEYSEETEPAQFSVEKKDKKYKLIFTATEDTLSTEYDSIEIVDVHTFPNTNHYAIVTHDQLKGAYNEQGKLVIPLKYKGIEIIERRTYKAVAEGKWGVLKFDGTILLPFAFDSIVKVHDAFYLDDHQKKNDHYIVKAKNKYGVVNSKNETILETIYNEIKTPAFCTCPIEYIIKKGTLYGLTDHTGKVIIEPKYLSIAPFLSSNFTVVTTQKNREGYINYTGKEYFSE